MAKYLEKKGEGLHHVGYRVADCAEALQSVKDHGGRVIDEVPRPGSRGTTVAFVHPKGCVRHPHRARPGVSGRVDGQQPRAAAGPTPLSEPSGRPRCRRSVSPASRSPPTGTRPPGSRSRAMRVRTRGRPGPSADPPRAATDRRRLVAADRSAGPDRPGDRPRRRASRRASRPSCGPTCTCWSTPGPAGPSTSAGAGTTAASAMSARPAAGADGPIGDLGGADRRSSRCSTGSGRSRPTGRTVRIDILRYGLSADEALAGRGRRPRRPRAAGRTRARTASAGAAVEVGSLLAKRAKFKRGHQVVLLRVGAAGADTSYDRVRHGWRDRTAVDRPRLAPVAPVGGDRGRRPGRGGLPDRTVGGTGPRRCVGRPGRAEPRPPTGSPSSGHPIPSSRTATCGKSVAAYLGAGAPSPVTYVWCGPHWVNTPA